MLWVSSFVVLYLRPTQLSLLSTSSNPLLNPLYCRITYSVRPLYVWEFRQNSAKLLTPRVHIQLPHRRQLAQNYFAYSCSVQTRHKWTHAEPYSATPVYYGWRLPLPRKSLDTECTNPWKTCFSTRTDEHFVKTVHSVLLQSLFY